MRVFASPLDVHATTTWHHWTPFDADCAFGAENIATALHGRAALKQNPPLAEEEMDIAVRWAMGYALITDQPVPTAMSTSVQEQLSLHKVSGASACPHPAEMQAPSKGQNTLRIPADFWLENESAYKVRNKDVAEATMMLVVANRPSASEYCNAESSIRLASPSCQHLGNLEGIGILQPIEGSLERWCLLEILCQV